MSEVTLMHPFNRVHGFVIHSYNEFVVADKGVVKVDSSNTGMLELVWRRGFKLNPEGKTLFTTQDLWNEVSTQTAESADTEEETPRRRNARRISEV